MRSFYLIIIIFISSFANAYWLSPKSLIRLISDSQIIVVAQVESIEEGRNHVEVVEFPNELTKVNLVVLDALKGNLDGKLTVMSDTFFTYQEAVKKYKKGSKVLVFLDKTPLDNTYKAFDINHILKNVQDKGFGVYVKRIEEMQQILQVSDETEQRKEIIEWLVKCAENKIMRSEGLLDLNPTRDPMSYYKRNKDTITSEFSITKKQKQRLRTTLFAIEELTYVDFGLVNLVKEDNDSELIQFLITRFTDYDYNPFNYEKAYMVRTYMLNLVKITQNKKLINIK